MNTTKKQTLEPVDQVEELAQDLLRRFDLLRGDSVPGDISNAQYRTLAAVHSHGPMSIGKLVQVMGSRQSTTSEMVTHLMRLELLTKVRGPFDGRIVMVALTHEGEQWRQRRRQRARDGYQKVMSWLSPGDRGLFLSALKQLVELFGKGSESSCCPNPKPDEREISSPHQERVRSAPPLAGHSARRQGESVTGKATAVRVFSAKQVAQMCRVSHESIRRWIRKYGLKAYNTTDGLAIKIVEADLREFSERLRVYVDWESVDEED